MTGAVRRRAIGFGLLILIVAAIALARMLVYLDVDGGLEIGWPDASVARYRWTPLIAGATVGVALAISGLLLQALLRNPLASPFILGASSGAALGVIIAMYVAHVAGRIAVAGGGLAGAALVGALAVLAIVYGLGQRRGWLDPVSLILVGVIVSTICGAGIMLFQHLVTHGLRSDLTVWMMGHIPQATPAGTLWLTVGATVVGAGVALAMGRAMDAATLGDDEARSIGLALGTVRLWLFVVAGLLAAVSVALAGPIGFVGLIAPHTARLVLGPRHTALVIGSALCGAALVVGADTARQAISLGGGRIPIGVFTALIGGPAFIWLLRTGRGQV